MNPGPVSTPREVITSALEDWWLTADPTADPDPTEAACLAVAYLTGAGYTIHPEGTPMTTDRPNRRASRNAALLTAFLTTVCLAGGTVSLIRQDWGWFTAAITGAALLAYEFTQDLAAHRHNRTVTRPQKRPRT